MEVRNDRYNLGQCWTINFGICCKQREVLKTLLEEGHKGIDIVELYVWLRPYDVWWLWSLTLWTCAASWAKAVKNEKVKYYSNFNTGMKVCIKVTGYHYDVGGREGRGERLIREVEGMKVRAKSRFWLWASWGHNERELRMVTCLILIVIEEKTSLSSKTCPGD